MRFVVVRGGDWEGLYVDGVLLCEGHVLSVDAVINAVTSSYPGSTFTTLTPNDDWLEKVGYLPQDLDDVKKA